MHYRNAVIGTMAVVTFCTPRRGLDFNPLIATFKPQNDGSSYSYIVDGWVVTFGAARRGLGGLRPRPVASSLYQMQQVAHPSTP